MAVLRLAGLALIHAWCKQKCPSSGETELKKGGLGNKRSASGWTQHVTCMLVAPVTDPGSRRPISSRQEESGTFHSEEAFADAAREETNSA